MTIRKMLLFDIDGTLLLTGGIGAIAFNQVFQEIFGIEDAWGDCIPDGKTDPALVQEIAQARLGRDLSDAEYQNFCRRYLDLFDRGIQSAPKFHLMPGVPELLSALSQRHEIILGVATGNFEQAAWSKLERGRIRHYFRFGGFGSDSAHRHELTRRAMVRGHEIIGRQLDPGDVMVVGDTLWDIRAGKYLGARTVGIATGRYSTDDFKAESPDFIFSDLSDLKGFLKILGSL